MDVNLLDRLFPLRLLLLRDMDVQDALLHLGLDLVGFGVVRQQERLLELLVGELAAEVTAVLLPLTAVLLPFLLLGLLLHLDVQVVVGIDVDLEVLLVQTRSGELDVILLFGFQNVDGRGRVSGPFHPAGVKKVIEDVRQPAVSSTSNYR